MKLNFMGDLDGLKDGLQLLAAEAGIELSSEGRVVEVVNHSINRIIVEAEGDSLRIAYQRKIHFFRAIGLLVEALRESSTFLIEEEPQFDMNGPMFDVSQGGAVIRTDSIKAFLRKMALMGLDMIMLYTEDSFDVKEQPYFGYMRGRYSQDEIREMDDYADQFGIEMIPCIQTLGHLADVLKWKAFADLRDDHETMLVGYDRTYEFIEQMLVAASAPVRSKRIHIGMDEAWKLGLGEYLVQNGLQSKADIMNIHLKKVMEIVESLDLVPMMWSDMYFRGSSPSGEYYDRNIVISDEVIAGMPKNIQFVYWDYYHYDEGFYTDFVRTHKTFGSTPIFAGGIWNWKGFVLNYGATFDSTNAALNVCKREGVREVFVTLWGDDGTECDWFSALLGLQLYAEHGYALELDEDKLSRRFQYCTGGRMEDFMAIKNVDEPPGIQPMNHETYNPSRYMLWQNVMMGLFDENLRGLDMAGHYTELQKQMALFATRNGEYGFVFEVLERLCNVLILKADIGIRITDAYLGGDKQELARIAQETLPEIRTRVEKLRAYHMERWHVVNKPFGWDIIDLRYGGLFMSLNTAIERISSYLAGNVDRLEELEEKRLLFQGQEGLVDCYLYKHMPTPSRISQ
ncbi:beta-N-acetylhexosaminidase [Paenibacillus nasutitermitis]|uniref:N-acetyl-beta-D-glucosaminidase n=1 Tax=Paenibacillus nasutitermitis TaxID=1652958 RepID=A0A917E2C8_9BACL|nr:beta-N-acetylhexosaminidase [Paenibacillus nasutitermitis]GGD93728.1 N-acetyl-beta-D-glucosaminidase [Paenibacillus nasutitermitis]